MNNLIKYVFIGLLCIQIAGCVKPEVKLSQNTKPGFSNITDIPIPEFAVIQHEKSITVGSNDDWAGHLVYSTKEPVVRVIDFINMQMPNLGWEKLSVLRGQETNFIFTRNNRVANIKIIATNDIFSKRTLVSIDMTTSSKKEDFKKCDNCNMK